VHRTPKGKIRRPADQKIRWFYLQINKRVR